MSKYKKYLINNDKTIKVALDRIDSSTVKILFVENNNKMVGSLTDGDIRRYLLSNGSINDTVDKACNKHPKKVAKNIKEATKMLSKHYIAIPIIDDENNILDIYVGKKDNHSKQKIDVKIENNDEKTSDNNNFVAK